MKIKDCIIQESKPDGPTRQNKPWLGAGVRLAAAVRGRNLLEGTECREEWYMQS